MELRGINAREAVGGWAEKVIEPVSVEDWDAATSFFEGFAHIF